ncbi:acyltransferase [Pelagibacteraceae bacterium]|nr:acyltransferase [Pelagibacteraceae bacterium]
MKYRADLHILRGLAILFVIGYHISSEIFSSGFLGVDIFFVLSGFLISKIYQKYNFKNYIKNRIKRLLPAYFFCSIFIVFLSVIFLNLKEYNEVIREFYFSLFFLSNFGFWIKNSYFNNTNFYPLLHYWSLAIEIQFYIIFPIIFIFFYKRKFIVSLFLIFSFLSCIFFLNISPKTSFYFLPFRLWEFLFGIIISNIKIDLKYRNTNIGYIFVLLILFILFTKTSYESHSFIIGHPGIKSLVICILTALIIIFTLPTNKLFYYPNYILEKVGIISYSLYLFHFPIIIFYNYIPFEGNKYNLNDYSDIFIVLPIILIISFLSYYFIENFFRKKSILFSFFTIIFAIIISSMLTLYKRNLYSEEEINIYNAFNDKGEFRCGKLFRIINPAEIMCKLNINIHSDEKYLLVGNSHANALKDGLINNMITDNNEIWFIVQNDPLMNATSKSLNPVDIFIEAEKKGINNFIIHYDNFYKFKENISKFIELISENNNKIFIISPVPQNINNAPKALLDNLKSKNEIKLINYNDYKIKNDYIYAFINNNKYYNQLNFIDLGKLICNPLCPVFDKNNKPLYYDPGHLTVSGSKYIANKLKNQLN